MADPRNHRGTQQTLAQTRTVPFPVTLAGSRCPQPSHSRVIVIGAHVHQMPISLSESWSLQATSTQGR